MKNETINKAIHECYTELYLKSTPSVDFQKLLDEATINSRGEKEIPFLDYEIDDDLLVEIIEKTTKKYKFDKLLSLKFKNTILLGCSPKSKIKDKN